MKRVILVGPKINKKSPKIYGGGVGGFVANMRSYLQQLKCDNFEFLPCFLTIRGEYGLHFFEPILRIIEDLSRIFYHLLRHPNLPVHILGAYRGSLLREVCICIIARVVGRFVVYEIKAGAFQREFISSKKFKRLMYIAVVILPSRLMCEGKEDVSFIVNRFSRLRVSPIWMPNFVSNARIVPSSLIKQSSVMRTENTLTLQSPQRFKLLFVGFFNFSKGADIILNSLEILLDKGFISFTLLIAGQVDQSYSQRIDSLIAAYPASIVEYGVIPSDEVISLMDDADVYVYPSSHPGEGHNNSVTEAMGRGLLVVCSRNGFLPSVVGDGGILLPEEDIVSFLVTNLQAIYHEPSKFINMRLHSLDKVRVQFSSLKALHRLSSLYDFDI